MEERLVQEYVGKELRDFLLYESEESINNRKIWICVGNRWNMMIFTDSFNALRLGFKVRDAIIKDIITDDVDITIIIENPFKGVD